MIKEVPQRSAPESILFNTFLNNLFLLLKKQIFVGTLMRKHHTNTIKTLINLRID